MMKSCKVIVLASWIAVAASASAQTKPAAPDYSLSFNAGATSDYRFRGLAQTGRKPAVQIGADLAHRSGAYLGVWGSNVTWVKKFNGATKGSVELDVYGGYKGELAKDLGFDVGVITYQYPGNNSGAFGTPGFGAVTTANTTEVYGALTYQMLTAKYSRSTSNFLGFLKSQGSEYFDLSATYDLGNGLTATAHLGTQRVKNNAPFNYSDVSLMLTKDMGTGLSLSATVVGTNAKNAAYTDADAKFLGNSTLVIGAKYTF